MFNKVVRFKEYLKNVGKHMSDLIKIKGTNRKGKEFQTIFTIMPLIQTIQRINTKMHITNNGDIADKAIGRISRRNQVLDTFKTLHRGKTLIWNLWISI